MVKLDDLDPSTPFQAQLLTQDQGPVVLVNTFVVPTGGMETFLELWQETAKYMKRCPGHVSTQLHRGIAGSNALVNVSVWESAQTLRQAHANPEFRDKIKGYPDGTVSSPHLFQKVAVEGVCVA
jgi:heme-degrading monooxygenase HmoA